MSISRRLLLLVGLLGLFGVTTVAALAATVSWGNPIEVPGTAALNLGGYAAVGSISCPAAHSCAAGGYYKDSSTHGHAFVANETNGTWGKAAEVGGVTAQNNDDAEVNAVSCATAEIERRGARHLLRLTPNALLLTHREGLVVVGVVSVPATRRAVARARARE